MARRDQTGWLGREGSNLRMAESKSTALPWTTSRRNWASLRVELLLVSRAYARLSLCGPERPSNKPVSNLDVRLDNRNDNRLTTNGYQKWVVGPGGLEPTTNRDPGMSRLPSREGTGALAARGLTTA